MSQWTGEQRAFVIEAYFKANDSGVIARRRFCSHYNIRRLRDAPSENLIRSWVRRFRATSSAENNLRPGSSGPSLNACTKATRTKPPAQKMVKKSDQPKRPMSAYMLWLNSAREQIKSDNPGLKVTEIATKGGEIWRAMKDKSEWEEKAAQAKEQYTMDLESYNENGGGGDKKEAQKRGKKAKKVSPKAEKKEESVYEDGDNDDKEIYISVKME